MTSSTPATATTTYIIICSGKTHREIRTQRLIRVTIKLMWHWSVEGKGSHNTGDRDTIQCSGLTGYRTIGLADKK